MANEEKPQFDAIITLDSSKILGEFSQKLVRRIAVLRNTLRTIEDESYRERLGQPPNAQGSVWFEIDPQLNLSIEDETNEAFVSLVRCLIDFIDSTVGIMDMIELGFDVTRNLANMEEIEVFIKETLEETSQHVGANKRLQNPTKLDRFEEFTPEARRMCNSLLGLRATVEHHKSVAQDDCELYVLETVLYVDGVRAGRPPFDIAAGQSISYGFETLNIRFAPGQRIQMEEYHINCVVSTILNSIAPLIIMSLVSKANLRHRPGVVTGP